MMGDTLGQVGSDGVMRFCLLACYIPTAASFGFGLGLSFFFLRRSGLVWGLAMANGGSWVFFRLIVYC